MRPTFDTPCIDALINNSLIALMMNADRVDPGDLRRSLRSAAVRLSNKAGQASARTALLGAPVDRTAPDLSDRRNRRRAAKLTACW